MHQDLRSTSSRFSKPYFYSLYVGADTCIPKTKPVLKAQPQCLFVSQLQASLFYVLMNHADYIVSAVQCKWSTFMFHGKSVCALYRSWQQPECWAKTKRYTYRGVGFQTLHIGCCMASNCKTTRKDCQCAPQSSTDKHTGQPPPCINCVVFSKFLTSHHHLAVPQSSALNNQACPQCFTWYTAESRGLQHLHPRFRRKNEPAFQQWSGRSSITLAEQSDQLS